jgi:hypothetical protein
LTPMLSWCRGGEVATMAKYRTRTATATQADHPAAEGECEAGVREARKAIRIMRNFVVSPVGKSAARDKELRDIWREAKLRGR